MDSVKMTVRDESIRICPRLGTGRQTVLNQADREMIVHLKFLGFRLPFERRIPYSDVTRVGSASRQRRGFGAGRRSELDDTISSGVRTQHMGDLAFTFEITAVVRGGKTIKMGTLKSANAARNMTSLLRQRLGLPETF